jgi:hypothetical protein
MELYRGTGDSITLSIYINGELKNADISGITHLVYVTITNATTGTAVVTNANANNVGIGKYEYPLSVATNSTLGDYKAVWTFTVDSVQNTKTDYYKVVVPYTTASEFRDYFPELSDKSNEEIYRKEKLARKIIDAYAGQTFDFETATTKIVNGEDSNTLYLPRRIYELTSVSIDNTDDITTEVELYNDFWIRPVYNFVPRRYTEIKRGIIDETYYFGLGVRYYVKGEWGWEYVPEEIQHACRLLVADYFEDDYMLRQHGVISAQLGDRSINFRNDLWGTTGNYDVDALLSGFTNMYLRLI